MSCLKKLSTTKSAFPSATFILGVAFWFGLTLSRFIWRLKTFAG